MGCDIHSYCECKIIGGDGKARWLCFGRVFANPWHRENQRIFVDAEDGKAFGELVTIHPIDERNYDLYGILANVRNGTWGEPFPFISEPRGVPDDASTFVRKEFEEWGSDGHSHSWLTLDELEAYNWDYQITHEAAVSNEQAEEFNRTGIPPTCYAASANFGTRITWKEPIKNNVSRFLNETMPKLRELSQHGQIRLVFWFDN